MKIQLMILCNQPSASSRAALRKRARELERLRDEYSQQLNKAIQAGAKVKELEESGVAEVRVNDQFSYLPHAS